MYSCFGLFHCLPFQSVLHDWCNKGCGMCYLVCGGARCSSMLRAFAHGAMGRRIDPSWGGPTDCLHCNFNASQSAA